MPRLGRAIWAGKWAIVVALAATMLPAILVTLSHTRPYRAEATMQIGEPTGAGAATSATDRNERRLIAIAVLEGDDVGDRVRSMLEIGGDVPEAKGFASNEFDVVIVRVEARSAELAATLANTYVEAYQQVQVERAARALPDTIGELEDQIASLQDEINSLPGDDPQIDAYSLEQDRLRAAVSTATLELAVATSPVTVVETAAVPTERVSPSLGKPILLSFLIGLALGAIGVVILNIRTGEVRTAIDLSALRSTEPVLAVVPSDSSLNATPIVVRQPVGRAVEAYAQLRDTMHRMVRDGRVRIVQFCSPNDNEGATATAVNLAVMLARAGDRVVVVDLDLRTPHVHGMLGLPRAPGVTDALTEHRVGSDRKRALARLAIFDDEDDPFGPPTGPPVDLLDTPEPDFDDLDDLELRPLTIPTTQFQGVDVVTAGTAPRSPLEVLSRRRMDDLMAELRVNYDLVILTSPGALAGGDASAIARYADGVVMVVQSGRSSLATVRQALATIDRAGSRTLGVLL
ncbi:MAG: hypothetical protein AB7Q27_05900, partial [Acidimicrobiia bacterium]